MVLRPLFALAMVSAVCCFASTTSASPPKAAAEPKEVRSWLMRIHEAASRQNFLGTFVVSAGGAVSSARIAHYCEGTNQFERIESMDPTALIGLPLIALSDLLRRAGFTVP